MLANRNALNLTLLLSAPVEDLTNEPHLTTLRTIENAWQLLCNKHFNITPTASQDAETLFWHTHYLRTNKKNMQDPQFQQALDFGHIDALIFAYNHYYNEEKLGETLKVAQRVSEIYGSPGYMLEAKTYYLLAKNALSSEKKMSYCHNIEKAVRLSIRLRDESMFALEYLNVTPDENWCEIWNGRYDELGFKPLTEAECYDMEQEVLAIYERTKAGKTTSRSLVL